MARIRKKGKKEQPAVNTASLPDIVFMLLFFFMVSTTMKEVNVLVDLKKPVASEVTKIEDKSLVDYIYVGPHQDKAKYGTVPVIQLDEQIYFNVAEIMAWKEEKMNERDPDKQSKITTSLKINNETQMGQVNQIKTQLREINALKINYSADSKAREELY